MTDNPWNSSFSPQIKSPPHVFLVRSSAGTGKTFELTRRFLKTLFEVKQKQGDFTTLIALTFTNKAADEMRQKILNELKKIALGGEREVREIASSLLQEIIKNYSDFHISTIDSFLLSILLASSSELGFPPIPQISENVRPHLEEVVEEILEDLSQDKELEKHLENFLLSYSLTRTLSIRLKDKMLEEMKTLWEKEKERGFELLQIPEEGNRLHTLTEEIQQLADEILREVPILDENFSNLLEKLRRGNLKQAMRSRKWDSEIPELKSKPHSLKKWILIKKKMREWAELVAFHSEGGSLVGLFRETSRRLEEKAKNEGIIFLHTIPYLVNKFLETYDVPQAFFFLGEKFHYYFIDEFQDTSILQWSTLYPLLEEALAEGGELFCVGDTKQAIYQFRGGDITLFRKTKEEMERFVLAEDRLTKNYRSKKYILDFVNAVFSAENLSKWLKELPEEIEGKDILESYQGGEFNPEPGRDDGEGGYVEWRIIEGANREEREEKIKEALIPLIKEDLLTRYLPEDIAILTRKNEEGALVTQWLIENNLPVISSQTLNAKEHILLRGIIEFLRFLNKPTDDLPFVSFITSDIFLKCTGLKRQEIFDWLQNLPEGRGYIYREFQKWVPHLWKKYIDYFYKSAGFLPVYDLVARILKVLQVWENFPHQTPFFLFLLEKAKEREIEGENTLDSFLQFWDKEDPKNFLIHLPYTPEAIQVMTIHASKGLEFPVVILPFATLEPGKLTHGSRYVWERKTRKFLPFRYSRDLAKFHPKLNHLEREWRSQETLSELNVFYVSLTRARDELYIFLPTSSKEKQKNLAISLFEGKPEIWGVKGRRKEEKKEEEREFTFPLTGKLVPWEKKIVREEKRIETLFPSYSETLQKGETIHRILSHVGKVKEGEENKILSSLEKITEKEGEDWTAIKDILNKLLHDPFTRKWFYTEGEVFTEKEVCDQEGNLFRMDRLIIGEKTVEVIDYKLEEEHPHHLAQIENYKKLLAGIFPDKEIKGYLVYLGTFKVKEV